MSISVAVDSGYRGWIATSSGNAGTSLAAYGCRAGLPGFLCVTNSIPREKLLPIVCLGVSVIKIDGIGDNGNPRSEQALFDQVQRAADKHHLYLGVTAHKFNSTGMRGADTIAFELEEAGLPTSNIYVPTGGGGLVAAIARGILASGADHRVVAVQPEGCAPIARFLSGMSDTPSVEACTTVISGLQLPSPPDGELAANQVLRTGGWGSMATDEEIQRCQDLLAATEGVFVEPAAAAALAAAVNDLAENRISGDDSVLLILTATGLKHLANIEARHSTIPTVSVHSVTQSIDSWAAEHSFQ